MLGGKIIKGSREPKVTTPQRKPFSMLDAASFKSSVSEVSPHQHDCSSIHTLPIAETAQNDPPHRRQGHLCINHSSELSSLESRCTSQSVIHVGIGVGVGRGSFVSEGVPF